MTDFLDRISKLSPRRLALLAKELQDRLDSLDKEKREPIAIVGMGCRFPGGADNPEEFWRVLRDGVDAVSEVPSNRWDLDSIYDPEPGKPGKICTRHGSFLAAIDRFDPLFFGISPREATTMDPQHRLLMEVTWETLENAGHSPEKLAGSKTGVFVGICGTDHLQLISELDPSELDMYLATGVSHSIASGRISYLLGLHGPSVSLDTACSSSLVAVHMACLSLRARECRAALAGGVSVALAPEAMIMFSRAGLMAADGHCKTFDAAADGYVRGEGCGMVLLKRLSDALTDGDRIQAVIQGSAVNQDGRSGGITAPNGLAQQAVIREALSAAHVTPHDLDYVEAHGTGTPLGDPIEVGALNAVYAAGRPKSDPLYIGSVKTNIGHAEAAAGIAGLIKLVLSLQSRQIPPHLNLKERNPYIPWEESSIEVPTQLRPWPSKSGRRIGAVSSFGFSGTNAHVVVGEYAEPNEADVEADRSHHVLTLSAKNDSALEELVNRYREHLAQHRELRLGDVCHTANNGRSHFEHRLAVMAGSAGQLRQRLEEYAAGEDPAGVLHGHADLTRRPEVVFLFAGQGGQYRNMGRALYESEPVFREVVERCEDLLRPHLEWPLRSVLYPGEGETGPLDETAYTHVAMFAVQYGLAQMWRSWGVEPGAVLGHSVGEIVAATVAGVLSLEDGLMLMRERGRLMQSVGASGVMASLLAGEEQVARVLEPYRERVAIAALNGAESTVISGERRAVEEILRTLAAQGVKTKLLKVSNAFHSPLVEPVLEEFERAARRAVYRAPEIAQFSSMRLKWVSGDELLDAAYWRYNLRHTVRFSEAIGAVYQDGYRIFIEIGPTPTLTSMGAQCVPPGECSWLPSLRPDRNDWEQVMETLGDFYVRGVNIDWVQLDKNHPRRRVSLPTYPFQRDRYSLDVLTRRKHVAAKTESAAPGLASDGKYEEDGASPGLAVSGASLEHWLYRVQWQPQPLAEAGTSGSGPARKWLIFADSHGFGASLVPLLKSRGDECVLTMAASPEEVQHLYRRICQAYGSPWYGIIHLWSLDSPANDQLSVATLEDAQSRNCGSVLQLIKSLKHATSARPPRLWVVTRGVQSVGSRPEPVAVAQAPLRGLTRVVAMEHPELRCVAVDLDPREREENTAALYRELSASGNEDQVAFRRGVRYVARLQPARLSVQSAPTASVLRPDGTYLITGGFGDLGMYVAQWMARAGARHVVLMGRRGASAAANEKIKQMRVAGVKIMLYQGDVSQRDDVATLLKKIDASMPPLRGIIHAAGVWEGGVLLQQDWEPFAGVLAPKVQGAWNLHELALSTALDFFVCFSSAASVLGAAGLGDYAAGNAFLDALAHCRQASGLKTASINWGPWAELGMVRSVTDLDTNRWSEHGMSSIPPDEAVRILEEVIKQGVVQLSVLPMDWIKLQSAIPSLGRSPFLQDLITGEQQRRLGATAGRAKETLDPDLLWAMDPAERRDTLTKGLQAEAARVLRLPSGQLDLTRPLNQFGLDSLMALELKNRLQTWLGVTVPLVTILSGPSVAELVSAVLDMLAVSQETRSPDLSTFAPENGLHGNTIDSRSAQQLLERLPLLSDDEVDLLLKQMARSS